jgi:predicted enzyme related to lactoylglutathione lyase
MASLSSLEPGGPNPEIRPFDSSAEERGHPPPGTYFNAGDTLLNSEKDFPNNARSSVHPSGRRFNMSGSSKVGTIAWTDLSVPNAEDLRDFYAEVVGWKPDPVSMGDYDDFNMAAPNGEEPMAGICHSRGPNADLPPVWLIYIVVEDLEASLSTCQARGGEVLLGPKSMGPASTYAVIRDPAGAVSALYQVGE